jgi:imidazolonepropionase-like amidohydrolase
MRGLQAWLLVCCAAALPAQDLVVRAGTIFTGESSALTPGAILITAGKIASIGKEVAQPEGATIIDLPQAFVAPGFIDCGTSLALKRGSAEDERAFLPNYRVAESLNLDDPAVLRHLQCGVTTFLSLPPDTNPLAGRAAVLSGSPRGGVNVLRADAGLVASLREGAWTRERSVSSLVGALEAFEGTELEGLRTGSSAGLLLLTSSGRELLAATKVQALAQAPAIWFLAADADECVLPAKETARAIVLGPVLPALHDRHLDLPRTIMAAGHRLAFQTTAPRHGGATLRLAAITATQHGVDRDDALRALTHTAAEVLGVADRVGSLASGKEGDLVIFDRHPLDARARLLYVVQDGALVDLTKEN